MNIKKLREKAKGKKENEKTDQKAKSINSPKGKGYGKKAYGRNS